MRLLNRRGTVAARLASGLGLMFFALSACTSEPTESEVLADQVDGKTWLSTIALVDGGFGPEPQQLEPGTRILAAFDDGRLRVHSGCRTTSASVLIGSAGATTLTDLNEEGAPCEGALGDQDRLIADLLLEGPTITIEEDVMTWTGRTLVVEFIDEEAVVAE